ncbi:MAG: hypothetical protein ACTHNG_15235 [Ginsengibacter sp.]
MSTGKVGIFCRCWPGEELGLFVGLPGDLVGVLTDFYEQTNK